MIYSDKTAVFGQDVDLNGYLRPSVLLAKMEDAGSRQMEACPPSNDDLRAEGMAFIISRLLLRIDRPLREGETADARSFATDSRGVSHNRCYRMFSGAECVAEAYTVWALLNFRTHKLVRVGETAPLGGAPEPPIDVGIPAREPFPPAEAFCKVGVREVYFSDADRNGHLNNTKYLNWLCDFVPGIAKKTLSTANVSFISEAPLGEVLTVLRAEADGRYFFKLQRADGKLCCEAILGFADLPKA